MSEESQVLVASGSGIQTVTQQMATTSSQVVYLDIDGEEKSYNGELPTIDNVVVSDSIFDSDSNMFIVKSSNEPFDDDIAVMPDLPETNEYSTIYIGVTSAVDDSGGIFGLDETVDSVNKKRDGNFALLDSAATTELVTSVVAHDTRHVVNGLEYDGMGQERYTVSSMANGQMDDGNPTRGTYVPGTWGDNLADAKAYAKAHNVPIFVYYGDPSWCGPCRNLEAEVFEAEDFQQYANTGSVVLLDNVPIDGLSYSGIPTCFMLDADGNVLSQRVGFGSGAHDSWMNWFDDYVTFVSDNQTFNYVPGTWGDNFEDAKAYAKAHDNIPIFVYYGDPSWCGPCRNLEAEVFEAEDFLRYANSGSVVLLDNVPIDGLTHPSIPTCYILDADGNVLSKYVGFGSHDPWMAWFEQNVPPIPVDLDLVKVYSSGTLVSSSNVLSDMTLSAGGNNVMNVSSGGRALSTKINNGGSMSILAGGAASDTQVSSGGRLIASSGAILGGTTVVGGNLVVSGSVNAANIVFAVNQRTTADGYILNDLAALHAESISVRVDDSQGYGRYKLAANAAGFNGTITIWNGSGSVSYGTISVSSPVCVGMTCYSLSATSSGLDFIVEENPNISSSGSSVLVYSSGTLTAMADVLSGVSLVSGGNDSMVVSYGGVVTGTQIQSGGTMRISSGGVANATVMSGYYNYYSSTFHNIYASAYIEKGGSASGFLVGSCASLYVSSGARLSNVSISGWGGDVVIYSGASVNGAILDYSGALFVSSGGRVENVSYTGAGHRSLVVTISGGDSKTYVQGVNAQGKEFTIQNGVGSNLILYADYFGGYVNVKSGGVLKDTVVSGGYLNISSGGIASNTICRYWDWGPYLLSGAVHSGIIDLNQSGQFKVSSGGIINFSVNERTVSDGALITNLSYITGTPTYTLTVKPDQASGTYKLATNAADFNQSISVCTTEGTCFGAITVGNYFCTDDTCYSLTLNDNGILNFNVMSRNATPGNPDGNDAELSWTAVEGASGYIVEYSQDNFATCIMVETETVGMEHYNVGAGTWQWRVRTNGGLAWTIGNNVVVSDTRARTNVISATSDGVKDMFFVKPQGTWDSTYRARHMGVHGGWAGTGEKVVFSGENRFGDIFQGATDENVLLLTDDANGDALFVYDTFTESKNDLAKSQSRLSNIKEIRAGAGNDIVDLTSDQFDYTGGGLSIYGGLGDDTIWANTGSNTLFGDAGNDRLVGAGGDDVIVGGLGNDSMHGGGGNDIFVFGGNWGRDTIEQLSNGQVTLWFDNGSASKWNASTLTYTDGDKSVQVSGVAASNVTLKFGDDGSTQYNKLLKIGAFDEFSSERIFENKNTRGMLA